MSSFVLAGSYLMIFTPFLYVFFFGVFSSLTFLFSSNIMDLKALETIGKMELDEGIVDLKGQAVTNGGSDNANDNLGLRKM